MSAGSVPFQHLLTANSPRLQLVRAALFCAVALFLAIAAPCASIAWVLGAHVTSEQIALHDRQVAEGLVDHRPVAVQDSVPVELCQRDAHTPVAVPDTSVIRAGTAASAVPHDSLQSATAPQHEPPAADTSRRLVAVVVLGTAQPDPSPPFRPPISS